MNFKELLKKYQALRLENKLLRDKLKQIEAQTDLNSRGFTDNKKKFTKLQPETNIPNETGIDPVISNVDKYSSPSKKIDLFASYLKGRTDVYATRWENRKKKTSGYSPACGNEWIPGICQKPKIKCASCQNKNYLELNSHVIEDHLRGKIVVGIYPLLSSETCWFLAKSTEPHKTTGGV